jgi:hypothetical protein
VGSQQFGVATPFSTLFAKFLPNQAPEAHGRTVTNRWLPGTSLNGGQCTTARLGR